MQTRIHFSVLRVFMDICQTRSVSHTAERLGKSRAHVSTRLKMLEETSGLQLLARDGGQLYVNEQGLSIGKSIYQLANLEHFVHACCQQPLPWQVINVRIPLRFWGGGISRALMLAVEAVRREFPHIFLHCEFLDDYSDYQYRQTPWLPSGAPAGSIDVRYATADADVHGQWLLLSNTRAHHDSDTPRPIIVPKMPWGIMQALTRAPEDTRYTYSERDYTQWLAKPLADGEQVLVNSLLLTAPLRRHHRCTPFPLTQTPGLQCLYSGHHPALATFRRHFMAAFSHADELPVWRDILNARQWRYFAALVAAGRFASAADTLCITQPALSKQIRLMERALRQPLVQHTPGSRHLRLTPNGDLLADTAQGMAIALEDLAQQISERRLRAQRELIIGILPSVDAHSALIATVMHHVERWQEAHPGLRVQICEAPHYRLVELLRRLDIQLAITEADSPWLVQYPVFAPEALGLVAPAAWFGDDVPSALPWTALNDYPLVLLGKASGIRRLIDRHCLTQGLNLLPAVESESLNLNRSWVAQGRYATILPASAVRSLLADGDAVFIPLHPAVSRQLNVSHLRQRELNDDERSLLDTLIRGEEDANTHSFPDHRVGKTLL